jgi:transketolase
MDSRVFLQTASPIPIPPMKDLSSLIDFRTQVRRDILRMVHAVQSGHPGGSLGCTEFLTVLYQDILRHDPQDWTMDGIGQDIFFLSNGHISPLWYSVLARCGYFPIEELATFRKLDSRLQGHPTTHEGLPGVRIASGSLGQGLSAAIGAALSKKLNNDDHLVYVLMGDGELQEGQVWEAAMFAAARNVDNLIAAVDLNGQQIDGATSDVMPLGDLKAKFEAFGWQVIGMNGNDLEEVRSTLLKAITMTGLQRPTMILMQTAMGNGVDFMMHSHKWHGVAPNDQQLVTALEQNPITLGDY